MKCEKYDTCSLTDCGQCSNNEIRWTDKVYLDSQGNIRSTDGCPTDQVSQDIMYYPQVNGITPTVIKEDEE